MIAKGKTKLSLADMVGKLGNDRELSPDLSPPPGGQDDRRKPEPAGGA